MNKIDGYNVYQQTYVDNKRKMEQAKPEKKDVQKTETSSSKVELSDKAKELLKELQKKYGNMDIMVGDTSNEAEASEIMSRGTKEYSVMFDAEELEKMANDEDYKNKQLTSLEEATQSLDSIKDKLKEALGEDADSLDRVGISVGSDGTIQYFAYLKKEAEVRSEKLQEAREAKAEERKEEKAEFLEKLRENKKIDIIAEDRTEKKYEKHAFVSASSEVELLEKVTGVDWNNVSEVFIPQRSQKLDLSV